VNRSRRAFPLGAIALIAACQGEQDTRPAPWFREPPEAATSSLLLVTLDTFRADAAGCGGDPGGRTPHLDRIARSGTQFMTGLCGSPLTLPSHACMLTGRDGPAHGVRDNGTFRLPEGIPTLATELKAREFATGAFLGAFPLDARFGLDRGFDVYDDDVGGPTGEGGIVMAQRAGGEVARSADRWWASLAPGRRWFAWVHLFDAHTPHEAPGPLLAASRGDDYRADVAWCDRFLGSATRSAALRDDSHWIVVVGDHGESRGDHGEATHGVFVYDSTIRIPAVISPSLAGAPKGLVRSVFRTIDVPATVFELLGLEPADAPGEGISVLTDEAGPAYMESFFAHFHYGWASLAAVQEGEWKYVEGPEPELYRLDVDPGETRNVAAEHPERAALMAGWIREIASRGRSAAAAPLEGGSREALESLGYVTRQAAPRPDSPDPKRMIGVQRLLETAQGMISAGRWEEALQPLRSALARDPRNKDLHQTMGLVQGALGRHPEAADSFLMCLELPPHVNDRIPRFELARSYLQMGRPARAVSELEILLAQFPDDAASWYNLGVARDRQGDRRGAEEAWERALEAEPGNELALEALGREPSRSHDGPGG
jgi:arylsulfatase A-like enzyme/Tfp pilus assembly protein PilF